MRLCQEMGHVLAHRGQICTQAYEDLGSDALPLADHAEQQVLGTDVAVSELKGLSKGQFEDLFGSRRERRGPRCRSDLSPNRLCDLRPCRRERDVDLSKGLGSDPVDLPDQAEHYVLGPDETVVEEARLLLGQDQDPASTFGESLEHRLQAPTLCVPVQGQREAPVQARCAEPIRPRCTRANPREFRLL